MDTKTWRKVVCRLIVALMLMCTVVSGSLAAEKKYPSHPINIYSPFAPGGPVDNLNRVIAKRFETYLGGTVVAECKPGGGGAILAPIWQNARPDGYTLANISAFHIGVPSSRHRVLFFKDFYIIGQLVVFPCVLAVPVTRHGKRSRDFMTMQKRTR